MRFQSKGNWNLKAMFPNFRNKHNEWTAQSSLLPTPRTQRSLSLLSCAPEARNACMLHLSHLTLKQLNNPFRLNLLESQHVYNGSRCRAMVGRSCPAAFCLRQSRGVQGINLSNLRIIGGKQASRFCFSYSTTVFKARNHERTKQKSCKIQQLIVNYHRANSS